MRALAAAGGLALSLAAAGCGGGYVDVGGYDATYVPAPPVAIESYPHYVYDGAVVYDVDGRFYRRHEGRWVAYRHVPPPLARWHARYHEGYRGRALRQR